MWQIEINILSLQVLLSCSRSELRLIDAVKWMYDEVIAKVIEGGFVCCVGLAHCLFFTYISKKSPSPRRSGQDSLRLLLRLDHSIISVAVLNVECVLLRSRCSVVQSCDVKLCHSFTCSCTYFFPSY